MKVYELHGVGNGTMWFFPKDEGDLYQGIYANAPSLAEVLWEHPPDLVLRSHPENRKKWDSKPRKVPDFGHFVPGSLIVSQKAEACIGSYLRRFGELMAIQVEGETWYNYVINNVLAGVVDKERSTKSRSGRLILRPVFIPDRLPEDSQIFKTPETVSGIYFNANHGENIGDLIHRHGLEAGDVKCVWDSEQ